jgi:23S rRNA (uracil1939-C5)-methyltransferase
MTSKMTLPRGDGAPESVGAVRVTGLSYGPHALARSDGKVLFVRGAVPGDLVTVGIREEHRSYAYAEVTSVIEPSSDRCSPPCPYLPRCGGCPWQHIRYPAQLQAKEANVRDHLSRAVDLAAAEWRPMLLAYSELGYRHRLSLRVADGQIGFFAAASHQLVPVDHCLLAEPVLEGAIPCARDWIRGLRSEVRRLEILLAADGQRWVFCAEAEGRLVVLDDAVCRGFLQSNARVAGVVMRGRKSRRVWGDDRCAIEIDDGLGALRWTTRAGTFTQVTRAGNRQLVRAVLEAGRLRAGERVLDLYAGGGNLSLPIARRVAAVTAVERNALAVEDGEAGAAALGIGNCEFRRKSAAAGVAEARRRHERYDAVVLDPPRSGAAETIAGLLQLASHRLVYVACDPATLARDLGRLATRYRVTSVQPIDLFPQTYHVETVVAAELA